MYKKYKEKMMAGCLLLVLAIFLSACGGEEQAAEATADGNAQTAEMTADGNAQTAEATPEMTTEGREETSETTIEGREEISDHQNTDTKEETAMQLMIGETEVPVTWEDNVSVDALRELVADSPLTIQMSMYGGFEQVGPIGQSIIRDDQQTTTNYGDIVLYSGNQIVVFYGSNSWAYTRLGHIDLTKEEMTDLLANGDVVLTISGEE